MTPPRSPLLAISCAALAALALAGCGVKREAVFTPPAEPFAVMLDGPPGPEHAALYSAVAHGQTRAAGLDVTVAPPSGSTQPLAALAAGSVAMAIARPSEVLLARDHGAALVAVAALTPQGADGPVLVVRQRQAEHDGEALRAFLHALGQGASQAHGSPASAVALLAGANPSLLGKRSAPRQARRRRLAALTQAVSSATAANPGQPYGYQSPAAWSALASSLYARHVLQTDPETLAPPYTNEFLPGQGI